MQFFKEAAKFVQDLKSLAKEVDESLAKHKALELEIKLLLRAIIERLQAQLGAQKGKSKDTPCVSNTLDPLSQKLENENVELEYQVLNYAKENAHLKTIYKNLFDFISVTRAQTKTIIDSLQDKLHDTIYENAKLRAQLFDKFSEQKNTIKGVDNTIKTRRPQPKRNTKNDRVPFVSKSSCNKNNEVEVEEHPRNLLLSTNKKHMSSEYFNNVGISHQASTVKTPQQNGVVERKNQTLVEAAKTMLFFSHVLLFLWTGAIATASYTQNRSIIHNRFNKTPYELINGRKPDISFLHVFGALCYPKNDREDIGKLGEKGDTGFFIAYSSESCAYRVYNRRTKKIIEIMNVPFDELSTMAYVYFSA
nr:integrase, catalytic region, zinc finger, CCHC-type, peptidase aspartic, catalytic [Tanacetum cinerariifolium]